MAWTIRLSRAAQRQLARLPRNRQVTIGEAIGRMVEDPFQGDVGPLKGRRWKGRFRKVVGRYRIIFIPDYQTQIVEISQILIRSEKTYR